MRYAILLLVLVPWIAFAQSNPGFVTGQVPTAAQWNSYFSGKVDTSSGSLTTPTISGGTQSSPSITTPTITNPTVSTGTFSSPTINTPTISNPTVTTGSFSSPTLSSPSITSPKITAGTPSGGYPVTAFGAACNGSTDDTSAIQSAINAAQTAGGGAVYFPTATCVVAGTLTISANGVALIGTPQTIGTSYINCTGTGTADCISITNGSTQIYYTSIRNLYISSSARTGGNCIDINGAAETLFDHIALSPCFNGIYATFTNTFTMTHFIIQGVNGSYGIKWQSPANNTKRSDAFVLLDGAVNALFSGADCLDWDGMANTLRVFGVALLQCNYGIRVTNSTASSSFYPGFGQFDDLEVDGSVYGVSIEAGSDFTFVNSDIDNNNASGNIPFQMLPDTGNSYTRGLKIAASNIHDAPNRIMFINGRDVNISGVQMFDSNHASTGTQPVVEIGSSIDHVNIVGSFIGQRYGDPDAPSYGVTIDSGAPAHINLVDNTYVGAVTASINDSTAAASLSGGTDYIGNRIGPRVVDGGTSGIKQLIFQNQGTTSGTQAQETISTGSANAYILIENTDGSTPGATISSGSGDTGGITIAPSSGSVAINGPAQVGATSLTVSKGELGISKQAASGTAPGAGGLKIAVVCGTNSGSATLVAIGGTSTTPVTILDNIGSGVTGC